MTEKSHSKDVHALEDWGEVEESSFPIPHLSMVHGHLIYSFLVDNLPDNWEVGMSPNNLREESEID